MCVYDDYTNMISNWKNDGFIKDNKQIISEVILIKII